MAGNRVDIAHLITPTPTPTNTPLVSLVERDSTSSEKSYSYPNCYDDPNGPCSLQSSSEDACSRKFKQSTFQLVIYYCFCTNGYYDRSLECAVDCLQYHATSIDSASISRQSRLRSLECESYSLAIESHSDFEKSLSGNSMSRASEESKKSTMAAPSTTTGGVDPPIITGSSIVSGAGASVGGTAGGVAPETMLWVDRPTATGQAQQNGSGFRAIRAARCDLLWSVTVILTLLSVYHRP